MSVHFSGCRVVSVFQVDPLAGGIDAPQMRFRIAGTDNGTDGTYSGSQLGLSVEAHGPHWSVTIEYRDILTGVWTVSPVNIDSNSDGTLLVALGPGDSPAIPDLVLLCAPCKHVPIHIKKPDQHAYYTWVSWGVMVDGGGPTGNGPVPPWAPFAREFAVGLMLAEMGRNARPELREGILELAATQVREAAAATAAAMKTR